MPNRGLYYLDFFFRSSLMALAQLTADLEAQRHVILINISGILPLIYTTTKRQPLPSSYVRYLLYYS